MKFIVFLLEICRLSLKTFWESQRIHKDVGGPNMSISRVLLGTGVFPAKRPMTTCYSKHRMVAPITFQLTQIELSLHSILTNDMHVFKRNLDPHK